MKLWLMVLKKCNDEDLNFCCVCIDCFVVCFEFLDVEEVGLCYVGVLLCLLFVFIFIYIVLFFLVVVLVVGNVVWRKYVKCRSERFRLLIDVVLSDDEDEGDLI